MSPSPSCDQMLRGRFGNDRMCQRGHDPQGFRTGVKNGRQAAIGFLRPVFHLVPKVVLDDVLVHRRYQAPRHFQSTRKLPLIEQRIEFGDGLAGSVGDCTLLRARSGARRIRNLALEIARDHGQGSAGQVAQPVRQIRVVALYQGSKENDPSWPNTISRSRK